MRWAVKPHALQVLPQGIKGYRGVLHLQTGPWILVGDTMPCTAPSAPVWFSSSFPLIDTRSRAAAVGVRGSGRHCRAPRAEVEVSVTLAHLLWHPGAHVGGRGARPAPTR